MGSLDLERMTQAALVRCADYLGRHEASTSDGPRGGVGASSEAEFQASLQVAREQEARSLELRAATDYARFMHGRGRSVEALGLLRPVYDWFTKGFDTRDLIESKALLRELE